MHYWLFKSEPDVFGWAHQTKLGPKGGEWTGVRNYQARNNMRAMKLGDRGFFYHSNVGKEIVGIVEVTRLAHPDSTADNPTWECVDVKALEALPKPVSLDAIKAEPKLAQMALVTNSRLSVQPVRPEEWKLICRMGGL
jgi:predicted RNA-binding protein with PUA-like domain